MSAVFRIFVFSVLAWSVQPAASQELPPLHELTVVEAAEGFRAGRFTAEALVEALLERIDDHEHLNAFINVDRDGARIRARVMDEARY